MYDLIVLYARMRINKTTVYTEREAKMISVCSIFFAIQKIQAPWLYFLRESPTIFCPFVCGPVGAGTVYSCELYGLMKLTLHALLGFVCFMEIFFALWTLP